MSPCVSFAQFIMIHGAEECARGTSSLLTWLFLNNIYYRLGLPPPPPCAVAPRSNLFHIYDADDDF